MKHEACSPFEAWHGTPEHFERFDPDLCREGIHFGTFQQAKQRLSGPGFLIRARIYATNMIRMKDTGSWSRLTITPRMRELADGIIYLNRHEGTITEDIERLAREKKLGSLDSASDAKFRKLMPNATDSWLIFNPDNIKIIATQMIAATR